MVKKCNKSASALSDHKNATSIPQGISELCKHHCFFHTWDKKVKLHKSTGFFEVRYFKPFLSDVAGDFPVRLCKVFTTE